MKTALLLLILCACTAHADELVINQGQSETLYEGTLHFIDLDGVNGTVTFWPTTSPSVGAFDPAPVPVLGAWTIDFGGKVPMRANCYPTFAYTANHGSRLVLDCAL